MSIKKLLLPIFLFLGTVFSFIFYFSKPDIDSPNLSSQDGKSNFSPTNDSQSSISPSVTLQKLSVLPLRCIGCGKCVRIDPAHFELSPDTGKSIVISSTNLNSRNLTMAINNCPVQAITLE